MTGPLRLTPGTIFAGDFEVIAPIAEGGMGAVYRVRTRAGSELALKVLHPELVADETVRRRFAQEAHLTDQFESPHVVRVYRTGIDLDTGVPFIAMEILEGPTLREHVDKIGALEPAEVREIMGQLCGALAEAHRRGMIHRDLKPENVVLHQQDGLRVVKLLDFGVAKVIDVNRTSGTGTAPVGSPLWMAPEQTSAGNRISAATDVWALGLIAFFLLTGHNYWRSVKGGGVTGLMREMHIDPIERPSLRVAVVAPGVQLPVGFDDWFMRAVCRSSTERYQDAGEAMAALRPLLSPAQRVADHSPIAFASTLAFPSDAVRAAVEASERQAAAPSAVEPAARPEEPSGLQFTRPVAPIPATDPPPPTAPQRDDVVLWIVIVLVAGFVLMMLSAAAMWILLQFLNRTPDLGSAIQAASSLVIASPLSPG